MIVAPIYVINRDKDKNRLEFIEKQFNELELNFVRFKAIEGRNLVKDDHKKYFNFKHLYSNNHYYGSLGCGMSHINLYKLALENNYDNMIIFEDDVITHSDKDYVHSIINKGLEYLNSNKCDIFYLGKTNDMCRYHKLIEGNIYKSIGPLATHAYIINKRAIKIILDNLPTSKMIDSFLQSIIYDGKLTAYVYHPSLFVQNSEQFPSGIKSDYYNGTALGRCRDNVANSECNRLDYPLISRMFLFIFLICIIIIIIICLA